MAILLGKTVLEKREMEEMEVERREKIEGRDGSPKVSEDRIRVLKTTRKTSEAQTYLTRDDVAICCIIIGRIYMSTWTPSEGFISGF